MKIEWLNTIIDGDRGVHAVASRHVQIGRSKANDIVLDSPSIADHAVVFEAADNGWKLVVVALQSISKHGRLCGRLLVFWARAIPA